MNLIPLSGIRLLPAPLLFALILLNSCAPPSLIIDDENYHPAEMDAGEILRNMPAHASPLRAVEGRARAQVSRPGESERATIRFTSDRNTSLLRIRNQMGIEGGRLLSRNDSVIMYNRIDEYAHKFSKVDAAYHYLSGITALNLVDVLDPPIYKHGEIQVLESERDFLLLANDGTRFFLDKTSFDLHRVEYPAVSPEVFSIFIFQDHAQIGGYRLPRRIQILSSDEESRIFLMIQSLDVNPAELDFDLGLPEDMPVQRL